MPTRCPPSGPRRGGRSRRALASPDWVAAPTGGGGAGAPARAARSDSPSPAMRSAAGARALGSHPERRGKPRRAPCWRHQLVGGATGDAGASPAGYWAGNRLRGEKRNACRRRRARAIFDRGAHSRKNPNPARRGVHVDSCCEPGPAPKAGLDQAARNGGPDESACSGHENLVFVARAVAREGISRSPEDTRTSLLQEALSSILQPLDQAVGAARGDDRRKFVAARRQIADGPVEIDVDHPSAADQIVYVHDPAARLH
jgi:hypothetical protein